MATKNLKDKKSAKKVSAQSVGATVKIGGKSITPKSVKKQSGAQVQSVKTEKPLVAKASKSAVAEKTLVEKLGLSDAWEQYGGEKSGVVDAFFADLWNRGEATPDGYVMIGKKKFDLREFTKNRKGTDAKTESFRTSTEINGVKVDLLIHNS